MKNQELFNRSISILVKAYMDGTLIKNQCTACAVGNLVAGNLGIEIKVTKTNMFGPCMDWPAEVRPEWDNVFMTSAGEQTICPDMMKEPVVARQIYATGYHWEDLAKIEYAFETAPGGMFGGLMAAVEILCEIHEATETTTQETKALFTL
jgi:hypothetical protein